MLMINDIENLFTCYGSFVCLPLWSTCSNLLPIFKHWVVCLTELEEFFIHFSIQVLWPTQMHIQRVQSEAYLFIFLFKIEGLLILTKFTLSVFPFMICVSVFCLLSAKLRIFPLTFSSTNVIVFMSRCIIYFELIFVYGVR